jgi:hypothetical protein
MPTPSSDIAAAKSSATTVTANPSTCKGCGIFNMFISAPKTQNGTNSKSSWKDPSNLNIGWKLPGNPSFGGAPTSTRPSGK